MESKRLNDGSVVIHHAQRFCQEGHIIQIDANRYVVKTIHPNGDAILETFKMTSKDTAIHDVNVKPKNYRSTYNSKYGRVW